jgi:DNA-binding MurR/RpiR family transcriptional regulator
MELDMNMNERDLENLKFLLSASQETLNDWYNTVDDDDIDYAMELLHQYRLELIDAAVEESSLREANDVLTYIMEK